MKKKAKRAAKRSNKGGRSSAMRELVGSDSPAAVLAAIDKFVANRKANCDRLSTRVERSKRLTPAQRNALVAAMRELSEALKLRVRVAKVVLDVEQKLRLIENSARIAIATAFADYQQRVSRG